MDGMQADIWIQTENEEPIKEYGIVPPSTIMLLIGAGVQ